MLTSSVVRQKSLKPDEIAATQRTRSSCQFLPFFQQIPFVRVAEIPYSFSE
jgi:hypothetical protein